MPISGNLGGFIRPGYDPLLVPDAPTIGTLSNSGPTELSLTFTAPSNVGGGAISSYTAVATDSSSGATFLATGETSPISITGLTAGNTYTAKIYANNTYGPSGPSAASNSQIPSLIQGQQAYTSGGTYSWVAPAGVTSVSVVCVGSSGGTSLAQKGGALSYKNNITVIPGNSYSVVVPTPSNPSTRASFNGDSEVSAGTYNVRTGTGGGDGANNYGGGAGGYSGNAGVPNDAAPAGGGASSGYAAAGGGGGVGLLGQGASGAAPTTNGSNWGGGKGGSGGADGTDSPNRVISGTGGAYGGGGGNTGVGAVGSGSGGAVRIIWSNVVTRAFPSTNTGNL